MKGKIKQGFVACMMVTLLTLPVLPVQATGQEKVEITVSSNIGEETMQPYVEAFEKKYPNISVDYQYYSDYENGIQEKINANDYGDVLFIPSFLGNTQFGDYFEPLGSYSELSETYNYMDGSKYSEDDVYGIPSSAYLTGMIYNKDVFNKAGITELPTSIEEFVADLQMIQERTDAIPFYTNYAALWTLQFWETFPYLEMTGDPDYKGNKFIYERNPFSKGSSHYQVYKLLYDIVSQGLCEEDPRSDDWEASKGMLNRGEIGCMALGSWAISQIKQAGGNADSIAFMPFPNEIDGKQYVTISTDYCYGINKNSEQKDAARTYIDFMLNESGYALDQESLSLLKTDPYPNAYGDIDRMILSSNNAATTLNNERYNALSANLNLTDNTQAARVIEAAAGYSDETFDDIINDWNERWESGRPEDMEKDMKDEVGSRLQSSVVSDEYEVDLSDTEQEFLKNLGTVRIGYLRKFAPFQYERQEGMAGLSMQLCEIMEHTVSLDAEYVAFDSEQELIEALKNGDIMMAAGLDAGENDEDSLRYSVNYINYTRVLAKNDSISIEQLDDKKQAEGASDSEKIARVERGAADYMIGNYYSVDYYIRDLETEHVSVVPMSESGSLAFAFTSDTDTRLISICNKCLYSIPDNQIQVLLMDDLDPPAKQITFARFMKDNPLQSAVIILSALALIVVIIIIFLRQRLESDRKHRLDVKRYETLAILTDEYVFEYDRTNANMHFDPKFLSKFGLEGDISIESERGKNNCLTAMLQVLEHLKPEMITSGYESEPFEIALDTNTQWYRLIVYPIQTDQDMESHMIGKLINVQKEVEQQLAMKNKAERDPLTGLLNRTGFDEWYEKLEVSDNIAFAVMDIDNFKGVNDSIGHQGGDEALKKLANTLTELFTVHAGICRYGGDEFMLCVYDRDPELLKADLGELIRRMDCKLEYQGMVHPISISLGAVLVDEKCEQQKLFKAADQVLYQVKEHGKNDWRLQKLTKDLEQVQG